MKEQPDALAGGTGAPADTAGGGPIRCALYARVSTEKQADKELSIPAQLQAMRQHASQRGWSVAYECLEPGVSGKTANRPALQELLSRIRAGGLKVDVVLVHKIDRFARNVYDHATVKALLLRSGVRLASVVENVDDTVSGQLVENIMASIAQFYSENLGEEVRKGMRQKVIGGGWPHKPPLGYFHAGSPDGAGSRVEIHPRLGPLARRAFELFATGAYTIKRLAERLAAEGLKSRTGGPIAPSHMTTLLQNPFYVGRLRWKGVEAPGSHPALVPQDLFDRVQVILRDRRRQRGAKGSVKGAPLRGIAICSTCRGRMTAERHGCLTYYRCGRQAYDRLRCAARYCNAEVAHRTLRDACQRIQITRKAARAIEKAARSVVAERLARTPSVLERLQSAEVDSIEHEMALTESFARGEMEPDTFARAAQGLSSEREELNRRLNSLRSSPEDVMARVRRTLEVASTVWDLYARLDERGRRRLLPLIFSTIALGSGGITGFALTPAFRALALNAGQPQSGARELVDIADAA